ncbi:MAG: hypothetical protein RBT59_13845 [Arcobacteraceae bacterium]|nr:hypothetical protein [Arcobacteraceae bacterium]
MKLKVIIGVLIAILFYQNHSLNQKIEEVEQKQPIAFILEDGNMAFRTNLLDALKNQILKNGETK